MLVFVVETVRVLLVMFVDCQCWFIVVFYLILRFLSGFVLCRDQTVTVLVECAIVNVGSIQCHFVCICILRDDVS